MRHEFLYDSVTAETNLYWKPNASDDNLTPLFVFPVFSAVFLIPWSLIVAKLLTLPQKMSVDQEVEERLALREEVNRDYEWLMSNSFKKEVSVQIQVLVLLLPMLILVGYTPVAAFTKLACTTATHLEGEAEAEIRFRSLAEREKPDTILTILKELYGSSFSFVSLQKQFFDNRKMESL